MTHFFHKPEVRQPKYTAAHTNTGAGAGAPNPHKTTRAHPLRAHSHPPRTVMDHDSDHACAHSLAKASPCRCAPVAVVCASVGFEFPSIRARDASDPKVPDKLERLVLAYVNHNRHVEYVPGMTSMLAPFVCVRPRTSWHTREAAVALLRHTLLRPG